MHTEVTIPTILRPYVENLAKVLVAGSTIGEILLNLNNTYPQIGTRILQDDQLRRFVNVYLNDEDVRFLKGLDTAVEDGDKVSILPAVAGG